MRISVLAVLTAALLASSTAHAQAITVQTASGSAIACVPMSSTSTVPPWEQTHGKVYHRGSSTENIVLFCQVQLDSLTVVIPGPGGALNPPKVMTIKYIDPDGPGSDTQVFAELKYADAAGNMIELATADSNAQGAGSGIRTMDADIATFDTLKLPGHIYVQLTIKRTTRALGLFPAVYGYTLH